MNTVMNAVIYLKCRVDFDKLVVCTRIVRVLVGVLLKGDALEGTTEFLCDEGKTQHSPLVGLALKQSLLGPANKPRESHRAGRQGAHSSQLQQRRPRGR